MYIYQLITYKQIKLKIITEKQHSISKNIQLLIKYINYLIIIKINIEFTIKLINANISTIQILKYTPTSIPKW